MQAPNAEINLCYNISNTNNNNSIVCDSSLYMNKGGKQTPNDLSLNEFSLGNFPGEKEGLVDIETVVCEMQSQECGASEARESSLKVEMKVADPGPEHKECRNLVAKMTDLANVTDDSGIETGAETAVEDTASDPAITLHTFTDTKQAQVNTIKVSPEESEDEFGILPGKEIGKTEINKLLKNIKKEGKVNRRELHEKQYRLLRKKVWDEDDEEQVNINKVAKLATELAKKKYKFPTPENEEKLENMVTEDKRTVLEVYGDIIDEIQDRYTEDDIQFLSSVVGYNASLRHYSSEGVPLPDTLVKQLSAEYKKMNEIENINKAYEELRGIKVKKKVKKKPTKYVEGDESEEEGTACSIKPMKIFSDQQIKDFIDFTKKDPSVLTTVRQKRQAAAIKRLNRMGKSIGSKSLHEFLVQFNDRYFLNGKYEEPVSQPQVLMLAAGDRLVYAQCRAGGEAGEETLDLLVDSGATHNILPRKVILSRGLRVENWRPRRGFPLKTAGQKVNNAILSECIVKLYFKSGETDYYINVPFLVCNDNLQVSLPILGKSFLNEFNGDEQHRAGSGSLSIDACAVKTDCKHRVALPTTEWPGAQGSSLYNLEGETYLDSGYEDDETEMEINAVRAGDKAEDVLSFLGGDGQMVEQPIREDLDEAAFRELDLMEALNAKPSPPEASCVNLFPKYDQYIKKIEKINESYVDAFARGDIQCGEFKLGLEVDPEVMEGMTAKQGKRTGQDHSTFAAVQKQMDKLEAQGIIEVSDNQEAGKYCHNLLTVPKKPSGSSIRQWTKADQAIVGRQSKMSTEDLSIRVLADLTSLNKILKSSPSITLPEETEVKGFIKNKLISLYDIKNGYFSLRVKESAKVLFNFYYKNMIYTYGRMPQGMSSSPFYFMCAMAKMLGQSAWDEFYEQTKDRMKHIFKYAANFADISKYYLDDIILASPLMCGCNGGTFNCERGFRCDNINLEQSIEMHAECHEAIVFAVRRSGMLLEKTKCSHFTQDSFVFLGVEYCGTKSTYSISKERVASVLSFRVPRSIAELNSRLSSIFYSGPFLPYLKKLALRLTRLVRSGEFRWGQAEMYAFNNLKMLSAIAISKSFYDPKAHLFIMVDSSKFAGSYCVFQLLQTGEMQLIESDTVALSGAESRNSPVQRELANLVWALGKTEKYLLSTHNKVHVVGDALCIQYLRNQRHWDSRCGNIALILSKYDKLSFLWVPGRFLGLVDNLSRQFHDVFIEHGEAGLSKELAQVIAPMPAGLRNKVFKMNASELTDFMMSMQKPSKIDIFDKGSFCTQNYRAEDIKILYNECGPIQSLIGWLKDPYSARYMSTNSAKQFFGVLAGATKTTIDKFIKDQSLEKLRDVLKDIDFKTSWRQFYPSLVPREDEPISEVNMLTRSRATACSLKWREGLRCLHTEELEDSYKASELKKFDINIQNFDKSISNLKAYWENMEKRGDTDLSNLISMYERSQCIVQKFSYTKDIAKILRERPGDQWFFPEHTQIQFIPYFFDDQFEIVARESKGDLILCCDRDIKLTGMEFVRFKCMVCVADGEAEWRAEEINRIKLYSVSSSIPYCTTSSVSVFNVSASNITIIKGTPLFKLARPGNGDRPYSFMQLRKKKGNALLDKIFQLQCQWSYNNLEDIFSEYLCQSHINLIYQEVKPVPESTAAVQPGYEKAIEKLTGMHGEIINENDGFINSISGLNRKISRQELYEGEFNLQTLLFSHHMRAGGNVINKDDIRALQNSDSQVVGLIKKVKENKKTDTETGNEYVQFLLKDDVLYRKTFNKVRKIEYTTLVIPKFLMREICIQMHTRKQLHINASDMVALIKTAFWSFEMHNIAKKCRHSCQICLYAGKPKARKTRGEVRLHHREGLKIKSVIECDLFFLAKDKTPGYNCDTCIAFCEPMTNFTIVYVLRDKSASSIVKALATFISSVGLMEYLKTDRGTEFTNEKVREFLDSMGVAHWVGATKNSTASIERQIGVFKVILNELVQRAGLGNARWAALVPMACVILQSRPVKGGSFLSRLQAFFSPMHYESKLFRLITFNEERPLWDLHKTFSNDNQLRAKKKKNKEAWVPGQLAKSHITRDKQKSVNNSNQLLPTVDRFVKVLRPAAGTEAMICQDLLSGQKIKYSNDEVRGLKLSEFPLPRDIVIKNMDQFVPEESGEQFARQIFDKNVQPTCFVLENLENGKELKSCLSKSPRFTRSYRMQYKGMLECDKMMPMLKGYLRAYWLREELGEKAPDWLEQLVVQPKGYGKIRSLLNPLSDKNPPRARHSKNISWKGKLVEEKRYEKDFINLMPAERKFLSVSQKELVNCRINVCSLLCQHNCERSNDDVREEASIDLN